MESEHVAPVVLKLKSGIIQWINNYTFDSNNNYYFNEQRFIHWKALATTISTTRPMFQNTRETIEM